MHHFWYAEPVRTTITLPEPLLRNAKRRAAEQGITLSKLLEDALRRQMAQKPPVRPRTFRLHVVHGKAVRPGLDLDRTSALIAAEDEIEFGPARRK
jgi:hypothetical protein